MKYIELSQGKKTIVDDDDYEWLKDLTCYARNNGRDKFYAAYTQPGDKHKKVYLHRAIMKAPKGLQVDHKNGNTLDNRKQNLRICTAAENLRNKGKFGKRSSKYKGVSHINGRPNLVKKWTSFISCDGKSTYLGYFETEEEAALAYNDAAYVYYGEYAKLNKINMEGVK